MCLAGVFACIVYDGFDALPHASGVSVVKVLLYALPVAAFRFLDAFP